MPHRLLYRSVKSMAIDEYIVLDESGRLELGFITANDQSHTNVKDCLTMDDAEYLFMAGETIHVESSRLYVGTTAVTHNGSGWVLRDHPSGPHPSIQAAIESRSLLEETARVLETAISSGNTRTRALVAARAITATSDSGILVAIDASGSASAVTVPATEHACNSEPPAGLVMAIEVLTEGRPYRVEHGHLRFTDTPLSLFITDVGHYALFSSRAVDGHNALLQTPNPRVLAAVAPRVIGAAEGLVYDATHVD